ncbi:hypothetical protein RND71_019480 [Anisodus tanguticus]|uniref:Uncharacterized protein n=1 Tax=Anisodus tanguticus TaxID=243964 RepID=A0AAE1S0M0_9SOLA|nr:hypothetical protein RND71_019480 [Anisodus tanguticus]
MGKNTLKIQALETQFNHPIISSLEVSIPLRNLVVGCASKSDSSGGVSLPRKMISLGRSHLTACPSAIADPIPQRHTRHCGKSLRQDKISSKAHNQLLRANLCRGGHA